MARPLFSANPTLCSGSQIRGVSWSRGLTVVVQLLEVLGSLHLFTCVRTISSRPSLSTASAKMMTSVSHARTLAGCRAFGNARPRVAARIADGTLCHMARKDSYMVEVEVAEDEPEDVAVRRYMKLVMQSRVVEKLRARKVKETKIEEYKRRFRERVEMRKAGIVEPTYEELYSSSEMMDRGPFDDFFSRRDEEDPEGAYDGLGDGLADDIFGNFAGGGYVDRWTSQSGGYMTGASFNNTSSWQGGYM